MARTLASSSTTRTVCEPSPTRRIDQRLPVDRFVARRGHEVEAVADRMTLGHLDQDDANAVGILDPHLPQTPWHRLGLRDDGDLARGGQSLVLDVDVGNL